MIIKPQRILILLVVILLQPIFAAAGTMEKNAFDGVDNRGAVRDRCLHNNVPLTIKKRDQNLYFVRVKNRYTGEVTAGSYGEARDIACNKKTHLILYNSEE